MNTILIAMSLLYGLITLGADNNDSLSSQLTQRREMSKMRPESESKKAMVKGQKDLKDSGQHLKAIGKGKKIPNLTFITSEGQSKELYDLLKKGPIVLTFYRGGWCPYCMLELQAYQKLLSQFTIAGATIVAVSPDTLAEIKKTKNKFKLEFQIMRDLNNAAAKNLGLAFKVDEGTLKAYNGFGINLKTSQGNDRNELPMPGTYVINQEGVITYSYINPDYTYRAEPSEVLNEVKKLHPDRT